MKYFDKNTIKFFEHLAGHNSKEWFDENREWYHESVKDPFDAFLTDLIAEVRKDDKQIMIEPKHAKFRINRDIRFSKNKEPYKTHIAAIISRGGRKDMIHPGIYVHIGHNGIHFGGGCYNPDKHQLQAIREAIASQPSKVKALLSAPEFTKIFDELRGDKHKRIPKQFHSKAEKIPLLYNKQFYFYQKYPSKHIIRDDLIERSMEHRFAAKSWNQFLKKALKEFL